MRYRENNLQEIVNLTEKYMQDVSELYKKNPKMYIKHVGMSHSKLITEIRKAKRQWESTILEHK